MSQSVLFDAELVRRYDRPGPRYTSYPTALEFREVFEPVYRYEVDASNTVPAAPLSLYLHIPFCPHLCFFCACSRVVTRNRARIAAYMEHLHREIGLQGALFDPARVVEQIHLGGGTPTSLGGDDLDRLLRTLDRHFTLRWDRGREFSVEIDPRTVQPHDIARLAGLGFNRISIGVQDFDPAVQQAVNRVQPVESTLAVLEEARRRGIHGINFDLIYGLPLQTEASFAATLDMVAEAAPDRIALYSYAHLPERFFAQRRIKSSELPSPPVKLALLEMAVQRLTAAGYVYIGMDHFARPDDELARAQRAGGLTRNFQGYSTHANCDLVGLGVTAIGSIGGHYFQNHTDLEHYQAAIDAGHLAVKRGVVVSRDDRIRRDVIQRIMCDDGLRFADVERPYGINFGWYFARELERLKPLAADGLVTVDGEGLRLTPAGRLLRRPVAMAFDAYLPGMNGMPRFSRVI
jgi:oxygen-independent coproporphyrinogen-3 oxidase